MKHKHLLASLIEKFFPDKAVGVEIGVDHADTTVYLLDKCPNLCHLYAIDPYRRRDVRYEEVQAKLEKYSNITLMRTTSDEAVNEIPNELDFIFIDGDHSYDAVLSDLNNYVPKIKSGGLLTGHDWTCVRKEFGVVQACDKYLNENKDIFQPLFSNDALKNMGLGDFKRGGYSKTSKRHLIHKKRPSAFPLWWLVKV
jgi:hypothetical protein